MSDINEKMSNDINEDMDNDVSDVSNASVGGTSGVESKPKVEPKVIAMFVIAAVVLVAGFVVPNVLRGKWAADEAAAQQNIDGSRAAVEEAVNASNKTQNVEVEKATGFDAARKESDTEAIKAFLSTACTWDSQATYAAARDKLKSEYGILDSSEFLTDFMPVIEADTVNGHGQVLKGQNRIDSMNLNLSLGEVKVYLGSIEDGYYEYFCDFDMVSTSGSNSSASDGLLICTVDSEGRILDPFAIRA